MDSITHQDQGRRVGARAPEETRAPASPDAHSREASIETTIADEFARLEALLNEQAQRARALEIQQASQRRLFRGLSEQLAQHSGGSGQPGPGTPAGLAAMRAERDAAVARALEAEAARTELVFRLDEVLGQLAQASQDPGQDPRKDMQPAGAQQLRAALAVAEETLGTSQARAMLLEGDLRSLRAKAARLERLLAEKGEQLEVELVRARPPAVDPESAARESRLREETQSLLARLAETEAALEEAGVGRGNTERERDTAQDQLESARARHAAALLREQALTARLQELQRIAAETPQQPTADLHRALQDARAALVEVAHVIASGAAEPSSGPPEDRFRTAPGMVDVPAESIVNDTDVGERVALLKADLIKTLEALETERAAHAASVASHIAQAARSREKSQETSEQLEVLRGRLRAASDRALGLQEQVSSTHPMATAVGELLDLLQD